MITTKFTSNEQALEHGQETLLTTFIPSPFFLLLAIENGWKVAGIELVPSEDERSLVYLVTLKSQSFQPDQKVVLPTNALVKKILSQYSQENVPVEAGSLI